MASADVHLSAAKLVSAARKDLASKVCLSYPTRIISLLSMMYTYMWCHGRSSASSPPTPTTFMRLYGFTQGPSSSS